jgi:plastocyanin
MSSTSRRVVALPAVVALALSTSVLLAGSSTEVPGVVRIGGRPAGDVVVWLDQARRPGAASERVTLDQRNLTFSPRVLAVRVGTSVRMPNSDRVFHNVFSFKDGKKFDLGLYPVGLSKVVTFDRPGVSRVFCNIHPNMAAYVVAVDSDVFAVSNQSGAFTLGTVPNGSYTYRVWRAGAEVASGQLVVDAGSRLVVDLP